MLLVQTAEISVMEDRYASFITRFSESQPSDKEQRDGRFEEWTVSSVLPLLFVRTVKEESMLYGADIQ